jgi:hypothetical protein
MKAVRLDEARLYDEQFARVFPSDWEMPILSKYLGSAETRWTSAAALGDTMDKREEAS